MQLRSVRQWLGMPVPRLFEVVPHGVVDGTGADATRSPGLFRAILLTWLGRPKFQKVSPKHLRVPVPTIAAAHHPMQRAIPNGSLDLAHRSPPVAPVNPHNMCDGHNRRNPLAFVRHSAPVRRSANRVCGRSPVRKPVLSGATLSAAGLIVDATSSAAECIIGTRP